MINLTLGLTFVGVKFGDILYGAKVIIVSCSNFFNKWASSVGSISSTQYSLCARCTSCNDSRLSVFPITCLEVTNG